MVEPTSLVRWSWTDARGGACSVLVRTTGEVCVDGVVLGRLDASQCERLTGLLPGQSLSLLGHRAGVGPCAGTLFLGDDSVEIHFSEPAGPAATPAGIPMAFSIVSALHALVCAVRGGPGPLEAWATTWLEAPLPAPKQGSLMMPEWTTAASDVLRFCAYHGDDRQRFCHTIAADGTVREMVFSREDPQPRDVGTHRVAMSDVSWLVGAALPLAKPSWYDLLTAYDHNILLQFPAPARPYPTLHIQWEIEMGTEIDLPQPRELCRRILKTVLRVRDRLGRD